MNVVNIQTGSKAEVKTKKSWAEFKKDIKKFLDSTPI